MRSRRLRRLLAPVDRPLLALLLAVLAVGAVIQYSALGMDAGRLGGHGLRIALGLAALLAAAHLAPGPLRQWTPVLFLLGLAPVVLVLFHGHGAGATRWLALGPLSLQPAELLKLTLPMAAAALLAAGPLPPAHGRVLAVLLLSGLSAWLVALQPDLGTAILIGAIGLAVIFLSGVSGWLIAGLGVAFGASLPLIWRYALLEYQRERIRTFFDPQIDPLGSGYNIIQSEIAVGSGGLYGKGWTHGTQARFDFLPEQSTDFIFAVYAEEFGFVGILILFGLYLAIVLRLAYFFTASQSLYARLLIGGLGLSFLLHVLLNAAMTVGYAPVTGSPLPLLSYGGSALVVTLASCGLMMALHRDTRRAREHLA